jgi:ABC-type dipeptide/oligopeptide/nickel transport system permease component
MFKYAVKRLLLVVPVMFGVSSLAFILVHVMPGDAVTAEANLDPLMCPTKGWSVE